MRIACPNCSAEYEVPDTLLATGPRLLRCARCSHQFQAAPAGAAAAAPSAAPAPAAAPVVAPPEPPPPVAFPPPRPEPPPAIDPPEPPAAPPPFNNSALLMPDPLLYRPPAEPAPRGGAPLVLAWLLSLAILGAAGWVGWRHHAEIVAAWPPAERLYQALGVR